MYFIKANLNTPTSIVEGTLCVDNRYYVACNNPLGFKSLKEARAYFWNFPIEPICNVWIVGPRGGCHRVGPRSR